MALGDLSQANSEKPPPLTSETAEIIISSFVEAPTRRRRLYVDKGVVYDDFKPVGTVDVWKRDGLSKGYIFLDKKVE